VLSSPRLLPVETSGRFFAGASDNLIPTVFIPAIFIPAIFIPAIFVPTVLFR
jgi:hypothetical protein